MSSISRRACCVAAVGAIQGFRFFTDQRAFNLNNLLIIPKLQLISPNSLATASAAGASVAALALKSAAASSASQTNMNQSQEASSRRRSKSKDESLRTV
jgi:hypothetical protein